MKHIWVNIKYKKALQTIIALFALFLIWLIWPADQPFPKDYSKLAFDKSGRLLRVTLSSDQQYRFPCSQNKLPGKYIKTLLAYEDKRFYYHPGVDPFALVNAIKTNLSAGETIRGGSTITMQVARLANPKPRTYFNKLVECFAALNYHFIILKMIS